MIRLLYISAARSGMTEADLAAILASARRENEKTGVTGMLIHGRESFLQVLEGVEADVNTTFERIRRDPRHSMVMVLSREPIAARTFPAWSMGYKSLRGSRVLEDAVDLARTNLAALIPQALPRDILILMNSFYRTSVESGQPTAAAG